MPRPFSSLYTWVFLAIIAGAVLGYVNPPLGAALKPLADAFIALIKMLIGPVVFCTVVLGIAGAGGLRKLGRVGGKALLYFEVVSTLALATGLIIANVFKPGENFPVNKEQLSASGVAEFTQKAQDMSLQEYLLHLIPKTFFDAFTGSGDMLQILLVAILFGVGLTHVGKEAEVVTRFIETTSKVFFSMVNGVMRLAPIGAGAAMAYTVGKFGIESLKPLLGFMLLFYGTCIGFVLIALGIIARLAGFSIFSFIRYIRTELLTVLGTSSSESVLVPLMAKLERLGCSPSVVGIVIPAGYSFNLDGTNIYLSMAALFVAQALGIDLTLHEQLVILLVAMLTSKGASGVTGSGFITLAATLAVVPSIPVAGLAIILGIDRFMSEARALTNVIGNAVATIVISKWEGELDSTKLEKEMTRRVDS